MRSGGYLNSSIASTLQYRKISVLVGLKFTLSFLFQVSNAHEINVECACLKTNKDKILEKLINKIEPVHILIIWRQNQVVDS
jgi:hypothetical protein